MHQASSVPHTQQSIALRNGTKSFGQNTIFQNISVEFRTGTYTALIGPNGSGKSTLMSCILGQELLNEGSILLNGKEIVAGENGFAHQIFGLNDSIGWLPGLTVGQHLELLHRNSMHIPAQTNFSPLSPRAALDELDISRVWDHEPYALSSGQEQRVRLASLLLRTATFYFLDEPEKRLDSEGVQWIARWAQQRVKDGAMVCIATHDETLKNLTNAQHLNFPVNVGADSQQIL